MTPSAYLVGLADRLAYYAWRMIPLRFHNSRVALWLLPHAGAYAFKESE